MKKKYEISEFGLIRSLNDYPEIDPLKKSLKEIYLPENHFNDLYEFVIENQEENKDSEVMFSLFRKGKKLQIKTKNYVGVIETSKGLTLEILPKITTGYENVNFESELIITKKIFFKMLSKFKNSPFNIGSAHLKTSSNIPLLEIFIENYINEIKKIIRVGIRSQYVVNQENLSFLKGKTLASLNIKHNHSNKARFYCEFDDFSQNAVHNKLIKSTLLKLNKISKSHSNRTNIYQLLHHFDSIDESKDFINDLKKVNIDNRLFANYKNAISLSEIFLTNKSFTNFSGDSKNIAILFPMERVFEDYIGYLMKKYADGYEIKTQDMSYHLVSDHKNKEKFGLRPDIVATNTSNHNRIIFDAKWKVLDESKERGNYSISQSDMYQLYAYGKKYALDASSEDKEPELVLLYPSNPNFKNALEKFIYDGGLTLNVIPFDLNKSLSNEDEKKEVTKIFEIAAKFNSNDCQDNNQIAL